MHPFDLGLHAYAWARCGLYSPIVVVTLGALVAACLAVYAAFMPESCMGRFHRHFSPWVVVTLGVLVAACFAVCAAFCLSPAWVGVGVFSTT